MAVINFLIIAFVVFMLVKMVNRIKEAAEKKAEEPSEEAPAGPTELEILIEIRDALKKGLSRTTSQGKARRPAGLVGFGRSTLHDHCG